LSTRVLEFLAIKILSLQNAVELYGAVERLDILC